MNGPDIAREALPRHKRLATPQERSEWVRRYKESGLSVRQFCDEHKLVRQTLYNWLARSRAGQEVSEMSSGRQALASFHEIKLEGANVPCPWAAELHRPGGAVLRVAADAPAALVEQLLGVC